MAFAAFPNNSGCQKGGQLFHKSILGWDTHVEFAVELLEDGLVGGVLGHYLHETRVKIIDARRV